MGYNYLAGGGEDALNASTSSWMARSPRHLSPMQPTFLAYSQSTGELTAHTPEGDFLIGIGWAGCGMGKNNPTAQELKSVGPLPRGWYSIGEPHTHPQLGPFALRLTPYPENEMFGRDRFLIHGPAKDPKKYGQESKGCIIAARVTREKIHSLGMKDLQVIG